MLKFLITASLTSFLFGLFGVSWDDVDGKISEAYPTVVALTSSELLTDLAPTATDQPLLIDVREPAEFEVSHLRKAMNLTSAAAIAERIPDRDAAIVVYCSVGYRSAGVAAELEALGYRRVRNLHHSLFEWANLGLPMVNSAGEDTPLVHPFNRAWGALVDSDLRSYTP